MVIGGYYGFKNTGDEAILRAIAQELRARGHTPLALSARPRETRAFHSIPAAQRWNPFSVAWNLRRAGRFLLGGGGLLQDRTSSHSLDYYLGLLRLAKWLGKPAAGFNLSIGPLSPRGEAKVARAFANTPLIVRDQRSLFYAERLGLKAQLGADPALLLEAPKVAKEPGLVVMVPRYGVSPVPFRRLYARLIKQGFEPLFLGFQPGFDEEAMAAIGPVPYEITADPRRAMHVLASAQFVVSARLHGMILAAVAGTPFAGIDYDPKVVAFCEETGAPLLSEDADGATLIQVATQGYEPDWKRVEALKARARGSFELLFPSPQPANGP